jgi:hypothetical protein
MAEHYPQVHWQPSNPDPALNGWYEELETVPPNLAPPLVLDVEQATWPVQDIDLHVSINMIHISPWSATCGLMRGVQQVLKPGGYLYVYGPFKRDGQHTAASNRDFDRNLIERNPQWGIRDVEDVIAEAANRWLEHVDLIEMPANNLSLVFRST